MRRSAVGWALPALLTLAACSAAGGTAADPQWTPIPTSSLSARVDRPAPAWTLDVPATSPVAGGFITARATWFTLAATASDGDVPVVSIVAGDALRGTLSPRTLQVRGAVGQPLVFDLHGRPVAVLPVRRQASDAASPFDETAYDVRSGRELWHRPAALDDVADRSTYFHIWGSTAGLLVGQVNGDGQQDRRCGICALDLATGRTTWSLPGAAASASVAMYHIAVSPQVVAASLDGGRRLVVLDPRSGRRRFQTETTDPSNSLWPSVFVAGSAVVSVGGQASGGSTAVRVYQASGGRLLWQSATDQLPRVDADAGRVVLSDPDGGLTVRALTGEGTAWRVTPDVVRRDAVAVQFAEGGRVVATSAGQVVAWDEQDGHPLWAGTFARMNVNQWDGERYLAWASTSQLAAYVGAAAPLGVDISGQGEIPLFIAPRSG